MAETSGRVRQPARELSLCLEDLPKPPISASYVPLSGRVGAASPDGTLSTRSHRLGAEAVLVTSDFGPRVKPIAFTMNPAAGLPGKSVGDRRA